MNASKLDLGLRTFAYSIVFPGALDGRLLEAPLQLHGLAVTFVATWEHPWPYPYTRIRRMHPFVAHDKLYGFGPGF